jgi:GNAT superfamily N-acetyltransferase
METAPTTRVRVVRCNTAELTSADHDRIHSFISTYMLFEREALDAALNAAAYIWLCLDGKGRIVGTTAIRRFQLAPGVGGLGGAATVVYTSVVAVNPAYRRLGLPAKMGLKTYVYERMRAPIAPLYWVAEAISPAGYLLVVRNLTDFWPQPGQPVPHHAKAIIEATLAAAGIKRISRSGDAHIVYEDYPIIEREQAPDRWDEGDRDVGYFLRTNPDYWAGAAIVCLAPLNILSVSRAVFSVATKVLLRRKRRRQ